MLRYVLFLAFFSYWAYTLFRRFMYSAKKGGIIIWYVVYCPHQNMQNLMELCKKTLSEQAAACVFTFTYDRMKRYQGEWHLERSLSFPDYFSYPINRLTSSIVSASNTFAAVCLAS